MSTISSTNYNGRQPNNSSYIKTFVSGNLNNSLWTTINIDASTDPRVLTPIQNYKDIFIPRNIYLGGKVIPFSPLLNQTNIQSISKNTIDYLMQLEPIEFTTDTSENIQYGFKNDINNDNNLSNTYLDIYPILVQKIQNMQKEIDELKIFLHDKKYS